MGINAQQDREEIQNHWKSGDKQPWSWIFYGDSVPHGAYHTLGWRSFSEIFAERVRWELRLTKDRIINTAISGQTAAQLIEQENYEWRVRSLKPDAVFIMIGLNDIVKVPGTKLFRSNLTELVRMIRRDHAIPILQTYAPMLPAPDNRELMKRFELFDEYMEIIRDVSSAEDTLLIDHAEFWAPLAAKPELLRPYLEDGILHPGNKGHLKLAQEIFQVLGINSGDSACANIIIP